MRVLPNLVLVCLFAASAAYAEKKVYKCTNADGSSVFSPYPCGAGAQEMKVDTTPTPSPTTTQQTSPASLQQTPSAASSPQSVDAEDVKCREDAKQLKAYPARANLDMLLQRQTELMKNYSISASEAVKIQIGNLDSAIAAEQVRIDEGQQRADHAYAEAIAKCDARKAASEKNAGK